MSFRFSAPCFIYPLLGVPFSFRWSESSFCEIMASFFCSILLLHGRVGPVREGGEGEGEGGIVSFFFFAGIFPSHHWGQHSGGILYHRCLEISSKCRCMLFSINLGVEQVNSAVKIFFAGWLLVKQ